MLVMQPIGYVRSPYRDTHEIPKGLGAKHEAEGALEILGEFEPGLTDIEGFSPWDKLQLVQASGARSGPSGRAGLRSLVIMASDIPDHS